MLFENQITRTSHRKIWYCCCCYCCHSYGFFNNNNNFSFLSLTNPSISFIFWIIHSIPFSKCIQARRIVKKKFTKNFSLHSNTVCILEIYCDICMVSLHPINNNNIVIIMIIIIIKIFYMDSYGLSILFHLTMMITLNNNNNNCYNCEANKCKRKKNENEIPILFSCWVREIEWI